MCLVEKEKERREKKIPLEENIESEKKINVIKDYIVKKAKVKCKFGK